MHYLIWTIASLLWYPPGNEHVQRDNGKEKESHRLESALRKGYVTSLEGITRWKSRSEYGCFQK